MKINILLIIGLIMMFLLIAHKAFAAVPLDRPPTDKVVCVGVFDKHGEMIAQICPAPRGPETIKFPIRKGE